MINSIFFFSTSICFNKIHVCHNIISYIYILAILAAIDCHVEVSTDMLDIKLSACTHDESNMPSTMGAYKLRLRYHLTCLALCMSHFSVFSRLSINF